MNNKHEILAGGQRGYHYVISYQGMPLNSQQVLEKLNGEKPIDMILYCPNCGKQHIDAREVITSAEEFRKNNIPGHVPRDPWSNPPHRSHLCHDCGCIFRPADVCTNGVAAIKTKGKSDNWLSSPEVKFESMTPIQRMLE